MKLPVLAVALLASLTTPSVLADVAVTIDWNTSQGNLKNLVGLNGWSANETSIATNLAYQGSVASIYPAIYRFHAGEMLNASSHAKSWLNADGLTWNAAKIQGLLAAVSPHVQSIIVNIPKWPSAMASHSAKLPEAQKTAFANYCAQLADIVKAYPKVQYMEILNEVDNLYNGSADMTELMNLCVQARNAIRTKTTALTLIPAPWTQPWDTDLDTFITLVNKDIFQAFSYHNYATSGASTDLNYIYNNAEGIGPKAGNIRGKLNALANGSAIKLFIGETNTYADWNDDTMGWMNENEGTVTIALTWRGCMQSRVNGAISADNIQVWNDADGTYGALNPSTYTFRPTARLLQELRTRFSSGTERKTTSGATVIRPFAAISGTQRNVLLVNRDFTYSQTVDLAFLGTAPGVSGNATLVRLDDAGISSTTLPYTAGQAPQNIVLQKNSVNLLYFP